MRVIRLVAPFPARCQSDYSARSHLWLCWPNFSRLHLDTSHSSDLSIGKRNSFALIPRRTWKRFSRLRRGFHSIENALQLVCEPETSQVCRLSAAQMYGTSTPQSDACIRRVGAYSRIPLRVQLAYRSSSCSTLLTSAAA